MAKSADGIPNDSEGSPWGAFLSSHPGWVERMRSKRGEDRDVFGLRDCCKEPEADDLVDSFLLALSHHGHGHGHALKNFDRAIGAIWESTQENLITDSERDALIELLAEKFIENRFDSILAHVLNMPRCKRFCFYKSLERVR